MSEGAADPLILARVREAQAAIRRSLDAAEKVLAEAELPLLIVTGSAVLADFDLGDGIRRRAVSASILVHFDAVDRAIRAFRRAGFSLGQPIDELEIIRGARGRRVLYSLIEPDREPPVESLRLPTAHPGSEEGRRQRGAFMRAIMGKQIAATVSRIRRATDGEVSGEDGGDQEVAESDEFRIVPYSRD
ncbi:MAG: hypothetical protein RL325_873 [Planctomycetota bacterium]|jgi:hypothetical protein